MDTIGVGDRDLTSEAILGNIRKLVRDTSRGVHAVVVVMKMGRVGNASRANLTLLRKLFYNADLKTHGLLILTHWTGELGEEERDLDE